MHNFCETCTTAGKRAQLLGNVHNISETCTYRILENTGWGGETRYTYIYIYHIKCIYIYILHVYGHVYDSTYITVYTTLRYVTVMTLHYTTLHCIALHFHSIAYTNKHTCVHTYINYNIYIYIYMHTDIYICTGKSNINREKNMIYLSALETCCCRGRSFRPRETVQEWSQRSSAIW